MIFLYTVQNTDELLESWRDRIESLNIQFNRLNELVLSNSPLQTVKNDHRDV